MRLQHNIMAKSSYRSYKNNVSGMKKSLERLASGYKVNRAADDAAGLAISEKMRAQITGEEAAQKNAKDGISLVQTAEGALAEVHDILDRMTELATQSANGTYDNDTDRYQLQKEMGLLLDEINRIADSSNFNGIPLLDGSMDAGGSTVFTSGAFQIDDKTLHPAGIDPGAVGLPPVGKTLGEDTVLHTEGAMGSDTNAFSIDLHNVILNANSTISISVGDGVSITVTNNSDEPVTAKDIAAAINGDTSKKISVDYGDAKVGKSERGNVTVTLGQDSVFELKNSGTRVTFTQTSGGAIEMPQEVTVTDAERPRPNVTGPSDVIQSQEPDIDNPAKYTIDLSRVDVSAPGVVTVGILGREFDLEITTEEFANKDTISIGKVLADKLADALTQRNFPDDSKAGAVRFFSSDGKVTVEFQKSDAEPADEPYKSIVADGISVTTAVYRDGDTVKIDWSKLEIPDPSIGQGKSTLTVNVDGTDYVFTVVREDSPAYGAIADPDADNVIVLKKAVDGGTEEKWGDKSVEDRIITKLNKRLEETNRTNRGDKGDYNEIVNVTIVDGPKGRQLQYEYIRKEYIGVSNDSDGQGGGTGGPAGPGSSVGTAKNFTGDYNKSTTVLESSSGRTQDRLASTWFQLTEDMVKDGSSITIGRNTYTFTTDASKIGKDGYVVFNEGDSLSTIAEKLTKAAERNGTYTVGHPGNPVGRITVTEVEDQPYFDLTTMEGIEKSLGFKLADTTPASGAKGLTLQIGDSDDINSQLKISIRDCHPKALGIDPLSISDELSAAAAVDAIRTAVDYVSDVRGTLGAAQNRLEHTINNLGVMVENIQDSEASIRDADIAEEMMAYTKNNILIQASQSMLAQANQVPQGVLQLLQ